MNNIELLKKITLLKELSDEQIGKGLKDGSFKISSLGKNEIVHFEGEVCLDLEIILSGRFVLERIDESGGVMTVAEFFGDDILGGNILFSKNPHYPMTVTARQPSMILKIPKERLFELFYENHSFLRSYLEFISDHATILGDKIRHYVNTTIRESVMSYLDYESKRQNTNNIKLGISKKALAQKIGVQRTSLSRELAKMKKEGLVDYDAKNITILYK